MSNIDVSLISKLREITGAGIVDCKKALVESNGDLDAAIEQMRKSGQAKAEKKSGRTAAEGRIYIKVSADHKQVAIVDVNCETDFVANDENFKNFGEKLVAIALEQKTNQLEQLVTQAFSTEFATVEEARQGLVGKIGENIQIRRCAYLQTDDLFGFYLHSGRIGVVVELANAQDIDLAKDLAMHIAASNPLVVSSQDVPKEIIERERGIYQAQAEQSGKPAEIMQRMVEGQIQKFLKEVSLLGQPFVKEPDITIEQLLKNKQAQVKSFIRFEVGEGIEKQQSNFVEEVMAAGKN